VGAITSGKILLVGKFMHLKKEVVAYRDKQTGQPSTFNKLEFAVLGSDGVVFVQPDTRRIPGFKMDTYVCPFKSGGDVVVQIERMMTERGITTVVGNIEALEA